MIHGTKWLGAVGLAVTLVACGDGGDDIALRANPDVQTIIEFYERTGATEVEIDERVEEIERALDVLPEDEHEEYLATLAEGLDEAAVPETVPGEDLSDEEWCRQEVWEAGLAPEGWTEDQLMDDCVGALEGGLFDREATLDAYREP